MTEMEHISLVQDCSNSSALAMELLQSCTKPSIYNAELTTDTPYLSLTCNLLGVCCEKFGEN